MQDIKPQITNPPAVKPANPNFSSGPCAKRPGWSLNALNGAYVGRSHRAKECVARINEVSFLSKEILGMPDDWVLGIVPGSDTGAVEAVLWSMLGARGVDMLAWEAFGQGWVNDASRQLGLSDARLFSADYGHLPDLTQINFDHDVVFTWNGTTSGVCVENGNWIADDRKGLVIADATSAVFAMDLPWNKLDVVTWSWQKVLGGEGAHGMLALSPRAVERLESYVPEWPIPKIFQLTKNGKLIKGIFEGSTINTPSMLAVEDAVDALRWAKDIGGLPALQARCNDNFNMLAAWVESRPWIEFLAVEPRTRSCTSVCFTFASPKVSRRSVDEQTQIEKQFIKLLADAGVSYDIGSYRDAPPGIRIWAGATVETQNLQDLLPWLDAAWEAIEATL